MDPYAWTVHPDAEEAVEAGVAAARGRSPRLRALAARLQAETSTRLVDWIDHMTGREVRGYTVDGVDGMRRHLGAQLPAIVDAEAPGEIVIALQVDDVDAFAAVHGGTPEGAPGSALRRVESFEDGGVRLVAVERRSWAAGRHPTEVDADAAKRAVAAWRARPRGAEVDAGMVAAVGAATRMVELVGPDLATSYAMAEERSYWEARNTAARFQRRRHDALGLGWGNQDHHTFRSSRSAFARLMDLLGILGFERREQFFAGAEAGWGAQVLEQPGAGIVVFADVDLEPDEVGIDFTDGLRPTERLGTIGLWCALHGESVLTGGLHHLAARFDHNALVADLATHGVRHMPPFSTMPHLWQAFTEPELWKPAPARLATLVEAGHITHEQADRFATTGAPGSHLENITRSGGFKGFNQQNVSTTIARTDPRAVSP